MEGAPGRGLLLRAVRSTAGSSAVRSLVHHGPSRQPFPFCDGGGTQHAPPCLSRGRSRSAASRLRARDLSS
ncbi:hypothetical protein AURDEDRAFT_116264, partial [Auricularia subglabra TFB-10046 SS5]